MATERGSPHPRLSDAFSEPWRRRDVYLAEPWNALQNCHAGVLLRVGCHGGVFPDRAESLPCMRQQMKVNATPGERQGVQDTHLPVRNRQ